MYLKNNLIFKKGDMTYKQFADYTKVPETTLKDLCNGTNQNPKLNNLIKLAKKFEITIDQLVFSDLSNQN